jgi:hypothetical protein
MGGKMRKIVVSILLIILSLSGKQFDYAKVYINGVDDIKTLITNGIDVDRSSIKPSSTIDDVP